MHESSWMGYGQSMLSSVPPEGKTSAKRSVLLGIGDQCPSYSALLLCTYTWLGVNLRCPEALHRPSHGSSGGVVALRHGVTQLKSPALPNSDGPYPIGIVRGR